MKKVKLFAFFLVFMFLEINVLAYTSHDYPYETESNCMNDDSPKDKYGFFQNNCTSYCAYMLNIYGINFSNKYLNKSWGNAGYWDDKAGEIGITFDKFPLPGDIAYWNNLSDYGHVAWVEKVHFDSNGNPTDVDITEYNYNPSCGFSQRKISVNNPNGYVHILAYNEGVTGIYYIDCYEMNSLCDFQTKQEWTWILEKVSDYRCKNCKGNQVAYVNDFFNDFGKGGGSNDDSQDGAPGEESDGGYDHKVGLEYVKISKAGSDHWEGSYEFMGNDIPDIDVRVKVKRKGDHWHDSCVDVYFSHDKYFSAKKDDHIGSDCKKLASKKKYADQKEESFYFEDIDIEDEVKAGNNYYIFANITYSGGNNKSSRDNNDEYAKIDIVPIITTTTTTTIQNSPELISNACDYFEIWKTGDYPESEDLEIIFNPSFNSVYFIGQIRPNERWDDYPVDVNIVSISNWPKNQSIEFSVFADGNWLETNNCPEYSNGETNPIFRHFKLTFQKSIQNNVPTDETISSSCSYFQIIKTMDRGSAGDYQFVFSENFPENIILNGQKRPNDKWQDYQTVNKIVAVSNWPKGQPIEFSVKYYDAKNNLIWLDASKCPEYFNNAQNPNDQHFKVIFEN